MKIILINKYQQKVNRGAETYVSELSKRLSKKYEVEIVSDTNYFNLLRKEFDIIIPTNGRFQVFIVRLISWLKGAKMFVSGQSGPGFDDRLNLYAFPDVFIALTDFQKDWAKKINPFIKVEKIPNGVDLNIFRGPVKNSSKTVLSVGAFTKEKRHDLTISAVEKLNDVKLVIVGSGGSEKGRIKDLGERSLGKRFEILSVAHDKMPEIYRGAKVFAFPTVPWESFGIAMVEAMAIGLPVVANDDPIRREIVGNAGIIVDPVNTEEYARALDMALNKNWGSIPRRQAEKFNWDKISEMYIRLIKEVVK